MEPPHVIEHNPEIRKLRAMRREVSFVILLNASALLCREPVFVYIVLGCNLLLWSLMFSELARDLSALAPVRPVRPVRVTKSKNQGGRMT